MGSFSILEKLCLYESNILNLDGNAQNIQFSSLIAKPLWFKIEGFYSTLMKMNPLITVTSLQESEFCDNVYLCLY